jgi:hypothetical protein
MSASPTFQLVDHSLLEGVDDPLDDLVDVVLGRRG